MVLQLVRNLPWLRAAESTHHTGISLRTRKGIGTIRKFAMSVNPSRRLGVFRKSCATPLSAESFAQGSRASSPLVPCLFVR